MKIEAIGINWINSNTIWVDLWESVCLHDILRVLFGNYYYSNRAISEALEQKSIYLILYWQSVNWVRMQKVRISRADC